MNKITPFLWFDDKAEEAANFYISIFKNARLVSVQRRQGKTEQEADHAAVLPNRPSGR